MKQTGNNTPLLIVQVEPPQNTDGGDYFYRTHAPGMAMTKENGIYVINLTNQHRKKLEIMNHADILILKNICDPDILPLIRKRKSAGKLTVYEIADDLSALQPWNAVYPFYKNKENLMLVHRILSCCDALQVTVPELARLYGNLNANCEVFPNQVFHVPPEKPEKKYNKVIIGWGGSHGHMEDISEIADSLSKWIISQPNVCLHLMCSESIWNLFANLPKTKKRRFLPGTIHDYYNFLQGIDIGIAPLKDTAFNRSRSDVKFLEYAVSGVVPVVAHLEPYLNSVNAGKTGFLFKNTVDLIDILNQLIESPQLSGNIAKAARQYVIRERLQSQHVQERIDFYKDQYEKLQRQGWQSNGRLEWFEGLSRLDGAIRNEKHIRLQSTRFENLLHDGLVAMQVTDDKKLANQLFEEAAALEPENYLPFLFGSPVSSDPVNTLNRALELEPDSLKSWLLLGEEFERTGKIKEALESFESAVKICPEYEIPYLRVALLLKKLGEQSQSDWFLRKAGELEIHHPLFSN